MKNFIIRGFIFLVVFYMCMSTVVFGGAKLYTEAFGFGLAGSFAVSIVFSTFPLKIGNK